MRKQSIRKIGGYACLGLLCNAIAVFLGGRTAFTDQDFICGLLYGAGIILLLHAAYFLGENIRKSNEDVGRS